MNAVMTGKNSPPLWAGITSPYGRRTKNFFTLYPNPDSPLCEGFDLSPLIYPLTESLPAQPSTFTVHCSPTMEANSTPGPVILYASVGSGTAWNRALVLGSLSSPAPGRILNKGYLVLGGFVETRTNRIAHRIGLGPDSVAAKIRTSFGTGKQRASNLAALRHQIPPGLEKSCSRLMKYTLPCAYSCYFVLWS
jgi:hypothetical protein